MLPDSIVIAQSTVPISTAAPTHYVSFSTQIFLYCFQNFLGPLRVAPGALAPIFEFPFSRYVSPYFSDVSTNFHVSFLTVLPKGLTAVSKVHVVLKQYSLGNSSSFSLGNSSFSSDVSTTFPDSFFRVIYSFFNLSPKFVFDHTPPYTTVAITIRDSNRMTVAIRVVQTSKYSNTPILKRLHQDTAGSLLRSMNVLHPAPPHHSSRFSRGTIGYRTQTNVKQIIRSRSDKVPGAF